MKTRVCRRHFPAIIFFIIPKTKYWMTRNDFVKVFVCDGMNSKRARVVTWWHMAGSNVNSASAHFQGPPGVILGKQNDNLENSC